LAIFLRLAKLAYNLYWAVLGLCYNSFIANQPSVDELIKTFLKRGGRIDKYYLQDNNQNKHTLIYLKGWFAGKNIREALNKALSSPKNK